MGVGCYDNVGQLAREQLRLIGQYDHWVVFEVGVTKRSRCGSWSTQDLDLKNIRFVHHQQLQWFCWTNSSNLIIFSDASQTQHISGVVHVRLSGVWRVGDDCWWSDWGHRRPCWFVWIFIDCMNGYDGCMQGNGELVDHDEHKRVGHFHGRMWSL